MLELMPGLPDDVVGVSASGQVTAADYEKVFIPALRDALDRHPRVAILYHVGPAFTGFSPGAMWDDMKVGMAHLRAWKKVAVVTDLEWLGAATHFFSFTVPCPVKVFADGDLDAARAWIAED